MSSRLYFFYLYFSSFLNFILIRFISIKIERTSREKREREKLKLLLVLYSLFNASLFLDFSFNIYKYIYILVRYISVLMKLD